MAENSRRPPRVVILVPTYNEAGNLPVLAGALLALPLPGLRLLIVDDASPDGTGQRADELAAASEGRLSILHRTGPKGLGLAYRDGFRWALDQGAEAIVQMDADLSHAPADVLRLVAELETCDVAVGSRYVAGGQTDEHWGRGRLALSRSANHLSRLVLGLKTRDATAGFKAWRRSALEAVGPGRIRSKGYLIQEETAFLSQRLGLRVHEVPILFADRRAGRSKMTMRIKLEAAAGLLRLRLRHRRIGARSTRDVREAERT